MRKILAAVVVILSHLFIIVYWLWTLTTGTGFSGKILLAIRLHDISRLLAMIGFVTMFFQYVSSAKIKFVESKIGLDKIFIAHRMAGIIAFGFILSHPLTLLLSDMLQGISIFEQPLNLWKVVGFLALILISLASIAAITYRVAKIKYETWKNIHKAMYLAFPIAFIHSIRLGSDIARSSFIKIFWWVLMAIFLCVMVYKLWMRFVIRKSPFRVVEVKQETHDTWSLFFEGRRKDYKPGQFLIMRLVRNGRVSEAHPFTISSSPTDERLSVTIKSVGDFTSTVKDTKTGDYAYIDLPYGVFSFLNYDAPELIFIAGGIGITPFMSMLRYICAKGLDRKVTLIWGNKTSKDIVFKQELEELQDKIPGFKVVHVMSNQEDWQGEKGFIDTEKLKRHIDNFQVGQFFVCGPPPMMKKVIGYLKALGVSRRRIHYERFALR